MAATVEEELPEPVSVEEGSPSYDSEQSRRSSILSQGRSPVLSERSPSHGSPEPLEEEPEESEHEEEEDEGEGEQDDEPSDLPSLEPKPPNGPRTSENPRATRARHA